MDLHRPIRTGHGVPASGIANDRHLLMALGMSDSDAAMFLGKSRQALNSQLGRKSDAHAAGRTNYFKLSDILILASAARELGRKFEDEAIRAYVEATRSGDKGKPPYQLLMSILDARPEALDTAGANAIVFLLPTFLELRDECPSVAKFLQRLVKEVAADPMQPRLFILSTTMMRAKRAGQWLGVPDDNCFGSELADHYLPTVMVYRRDGDQLRVFVLSEDGEFVGAPDFAASNIADCVRAMLPLRMRSALDCGAEDFDEEEEDQKAA